MNAYCSSSFNPQRTIDIYNSKREVKKFESSIIKHILNGNHILTDAFLNQFATVEHTANEILEKYGPDATANFVYNNVLESAFAQNHEQLKIGIENNEEFIKKTTEIAWYGTVSFMAYLGAKAMAEQTILDNGGHTCVSDVGNHITALTSDAAPRGGLLAATYYILTAQIAQGEAPPTPGVFFDIYGNILNGTDWVNGSILDANVSFLFYNQTTGEVAAVLQSQLGNTEENPQYIIQGINKSIVSEGNIATVKFDGFDGLINGSNNWTVVYPVEGSDSVSVPINYVAPTPKIEDFAVSLFAFGNDTKTNDVNVIANRSVVDSNYILQINGTDVATNETFSMDSINETYENLIEGWNNITLLIKSNTGKTSSISRDVYVDTIAPYIVDKTVNVFDNDSIEFLMNMSENANWTLYRDNVKIKSNKTNSTQNPIPFVMTDILENPGINKYTLKLEDEYENENSSIDLGIFTREEVISTDPPSSGGGSSGGGGSTGETYENIIEKYVLNEYWSIGSEIKYVFEDGPISELYLKPKKSLGSIKATIEVLKDKSTFVPKDIYQELVDGNTILSQFNFWVGNAGTLTENNVEEAYMNIVLDTDKITDIENVHIYRHDPETNKMLELQYVVDGINPHININVPLIIDKENMVGSFIVVEEKQNYIPTQVTIKEKQEPQITQPQTKSTQLESTSTQTPEIPTEEPEGTPGFEIGLGLAGLAAANRARKKRFSIGNHPRKNR
ncbi:PGF-pre-PGF domain-containing protein [archaeon]|nr:PGF-pre-PGF domain-containing protein [archaeon]